MSWILSVDATELVNLDQCSHLAVVELEDTPGDIPFWAVTANCDAETFVISTGSEEAMRTLLRALSTRVPLIKGLT